MEVHRGEVFYADLSPVVGSEQGGIRPVLIIQNEIGNRHSPTVIAAAITSRQDKNRLPTHISVRAALPRTVWCCWNRSARWISAACGSARAASPRMTCAAWTKPWAYPWGWKARTPTRTAVISEDRRHLSPH